MTACPTGCRSWRSESGHCPRCRGRNAFSRCAVDAASTTTLEVQVLGPLRLVVGGAEVAVPGPKRRAVLALLSMAAPAFTSADSLLLAAWPDDKAGSSTGALQNVISRLRRHLGPAAHRLESGAGGYRLRLDDGALDATRFTALLARSRTIMDQPQAAIALVEEARRMYRGRALEEFVDIEALAAWRRSLDEQRLAAADLHTELALAAGDRRTAIDVAGATVADEPLREASVRLLVDALAADGRAAEALRVAHDHRRRLAEETGLEPSPALGALEQRIAAGTQPPSPLPSSTATSPSRPRQPLIGRDAELAAIARLCRSEPLVTLLGPGGVGKTSLALEVAARDRTGRAVATVQLASVAEAAVADAVAVALGLRGTGDDPQGAIVALLESKPSLLVLDNCEHVLGPVRQLVDVLTESSPQLDRAGDEPAAPRPGGRAALPDRAVARPARRTSAQTSTPCPPSPCSSNGRPGPVRASSPMTRTW